MNRSEILTKLFNDKELQKVFYTLTGNKEIKDELQSSVFLALCEMNASDIESKYANGFLFGYVVKTAQRMLRQQSNEFNTEILDSKKPKAEKSQEILDDLEDQKSIHLQVFDTVSLEVSKLHVHRKKILQGKLDGKTFKEIGDEMPEKTNRKYIGRAFKQTKKQLKKNITRITSQFEQEPVPTLSKSIQPCPKIERYNHLENFSKAQIIEKK